MAYNNYMLTFKIAFNFYCSGLLLVLRNKIFLFLAFVICFILILEEFHCFIEQIKFFVAIIFYKHDSISIFKLTY